MKILLLGSNGQLGRSVIDSFRTSKFNLFECNKKDLDVTEFESTKKYISNLKPNIVINASAYTLVDNAEIDKEQAKLINDDAVKNIAEICQSIDSILFHISTDYVFDGISAIPYKENFKTNPKTFYGLTKLNGELSIKSSGCKYIIIRTSWLFSEYGNNFLKTMLKLSSHQKELSIINDQKGAPTYARDLADAILIIASKLNESKFKSEVYHFSGDSFCTWYDFAKEIFSQAEKNKFTVPKSVKAIESREYPCLAYRPPYSCLNCDKIKNKYHLELSDWKTGIKRALNFLLKEEKYINIKNE